MKGDWRSMCDQTGISLTRLISNNKIVLHLIPKSTRKNGIKSREICFNPSNEQVLVSSVMSKIIL